MADTTRVSPIILRFLIILNILNNSIGSNSTSERVQDTGHHYSRKLPALFAFEDLETLIYDLLQRLDVEIEANNTIPFTSDTNLTAMTDLITSYLKDYEETTIKLKREYKSERNRNGSYKVGWNPLATMRMMKRLALKAPVILEHVSEDYSPVAKEVSEIQDLMIKRNITFPSGKDYLEAISGLIKIQKTYHLQTKDIAAGVIFGRDTRIKLRGIDCIDIGTFATKTSDYALSLHWLRHGIEKLIEENSRPDIIQRAKSTLEGALQLHNENFDKADPDFYRFKTGKGNLEPEGPEVFMENSLDESTQFFEHRSRYNDLCSRGSDKNATNKEQLFCWYETKFSPYLRIRPAKVELLSKEPVIVRYYEIVGKETVKKLKKIAMTGLYPSPVYGYFRSMDEIVEHQAEAEVHRINQHLHSLSGFRLRKNRHNKGLTAVSYTFGTYIGPHLDALNVPPWHEDEGDRIATFIIYLSDVELGGGTAFLSPGVLVEPIEGSAIFWYNIDTAGMIDGRTLHGGCPVVLGEKWLGNTEWIRASDQFRTHLCEQGRRTFKFFVNGKLLNTKDPS